MKNKGLVIFFAVVFVLTCIYQLSFTWMARSFEAKAKTFATKNGVYDADKYRTYVDSLGRKPLLDIFIAKKDYFTFSEVKDELLTIKSYLEDRWVICGVVFENDRHRVRVDIDESNYDLLDNWFDTGTSKILNLGVFFNI